MSLNKILHLFRKTPPGNLGEFRILFEKFRQILEGNNHVLELMADLEDKLSGEYIFDINYIKKITASLSEEMNQLIVNLNILTENKFPELFDIQNRIQLLLESIVEEKNIITVDKQVIPFHEIDRDNEELVGGKNAQLAEIRNHILFSTPDGFAITVAAYYNLMDYNKLWPQISTIIENGGYDHQNQSVSVQEKEIAELFERVKIPHHLKKDICTELKNLRRRTKRKHSLAVRSSAVGEDTENRSYAGQFRSVLNISDDDVVSAYIKIITSGFKNLPYKSGDKMQGLKTGTPMAVSVQEMIAAKTAGVAYSQDPLDVQSNSIIISAVYGLGIPVVSGLMNSDFFRVSRLNPAEIIERKIVKKDKMVVPATPGGVETVSVPAEMHNKSCLTDSQIKRIAEIAFILDRSLKRPMDIEWAIDNNDQIFVLQSRALSLADKMPERSESLPETIGENRILLHGKGHIANRGIAAGRVYKVSEKYTSSRFPIGAVAVAKYASPNLTKIIRKTAAIITDIGSSTGHMATIAREFGVPTIVGTGNATEILADGMEITVDAQENVIYEGIVSELLEYEIRGKDIFIDMPEYKILRRILKKVAPLYLIDPGSKNFSGKNCRTYHDIIRFSHEMAIQELIDLNISSSRFPDVAPKDLKLSVPLGLKVIDLGGGVLSTDTQKNESTVDEIRSLPMKAILEGLTAPNVWSTDPIGLGFSGFMSSITKYSTADTKLAYQGQNLAVISENYMNLSLRLGYHFNVIDTYVSENVNDNYIYFRFVGGVTEITRRQRRATVIQSVLEKNDFKVVVQGDLVVGEIKKISAPEVKKILTIVGKLIGFTRQLDAKMLSDESVSYYTDSFFKLNGGQTQRQ